MKSKSLIFVALLAIVAIIACSPKRRGVNGDDDDGQSDASSGSADCATDCSNPACSGIGNCPVCGMVDQPLSSPLALPDTNQLDGDEATCTMDSQCAPATPNCIIGAPSAGGGECALSYVDTLDFVGFGSGETLTDTSKLIAVCATMEHSWLGDLQIELISPDGKKVALRQFLGRGNLGEFFLGHANDCDSDEMPVPGVGYKYCWTAQATTKFLDPLNQTCGAPGGCESWSDPTCDEGAHEVVPAGNYLPDVDFSALQGAQLNGNWTFRVTDLWQIDNGFLFDWSIQFDPSLVSDCSGPIIQ